MKKMRLFIVIPCVLFLALLSVSMMIPTQLSYPFKVIKGDSSLMNEINYHITMRTRSQNENKAAKILIKNTNGRISEDSTQHDYTIYNDKIKAVELHNRVSTQLNEQRGPYFIDKSCKKTTTEVDSLPISFDVFYRYFLYDYFSNAIMMNENNEELSLKTDLTYQKNENQTLEKVKVECENELDSQENFQDYRILSEYDNSTQDKLNAIRASSNTYYAMPSTNANISGTNKIYKITATAKSNGFSKYLGKVEEIVSLPSDRYYEKLQVMDHLLYVLTSKNDQYGLLVYDENGNQLLEKALDIKVMKGETEFKAQENYLLFHDRSQVQVIDARTLKILERYKLERSERDDSIKDLQYDNGKLSILFFSQKFEEGIGENKDFSFLSDMAVRLKVIQNKKVIFEGIHTLHEQNKKRNTVPDLKELKFDREKVS